MYGWTKEEKEKRAREKATFYREAADLVPAMREVINAFNGKCFNCRFEKALREKTGKRLCVEKRYRWFEVTYYQGSYGLNTSMITADIEKALTDGKRINADVLMESLRNKREELLKRATEIERGLDLVEEAEKQLKEIDRQIRAITSSIPYEVRDIYHLNARFEMR